MLSFIGLGGDWRLRSQIKSRPDVVSFRLLATKIRPGFRRPLIILFISLKKAEHVRDRHTGLRSGSGAEHLVNIGGSKMYFKPFLMEYIVGPCKMANWLAASEPGPPTTLQAAQGKSINKKKVVLD